MYFLRTQCWKSISLFGGQANVDTAGNADIDYICACQNHQIGDLVLCIEQKKKKVLINHFSVVLYYSSVRLRMRVLPFFQLCFNPISRFIPLPFHLYPFIHSSECRIFHQKIHKNPSWACLLTKVPGPSCFEFTDRHKKNWGFGSPPPPPFGVGITDMVYVAKSNPIAENPDFVS